MTTPPHGNGNKKWYQKRDNVLTGFGLTIISAEFIHAELLGGTFHYEFLLGGLALCGIDLARKGDKS